MYDWFREFKDVDKSETQSSSKGCGLREKESQIRKHLVKHGSLLGGKFQCRALRAFYSGQNMIRFSIYKEGELYSMWQKLEESNLNFESIAIILL